YSSVKISTTDDNKVLTARAVMPSEEVIWSVQVDLKNQPVGSALIVQVPDTTPGSLITSAVLPNNVLDYENTLSGAVEFFIKDNSGNDLSASPGVPKRILVDYSKMGIKNVQELGIFWLDPINLQWKEVTTVPGLCVKWEDGTQGYKIDIENKTISVLLAHFSIYCPFKTIRSLAPQTPLTSDSIVVYPNPFKPNDGNPETGEEFNGTNNTGIFFSIDDNQGASIKIYTVNGELVRSITIPAGITSNHYYQWDVKNKKGEKVASGVYIAVIDNGTLGKVVRKFIIIR
nr:hypothetical protein [bacterium]